MKNTTLKRSLNLPLLTLYGLGTILGAGIYVLVGKVAGIAGLYTPFAFLVSAILAAFTGFSYAQLSMRYPYSAGEAVYIKHALSNQTISATIGWLVILTGIVSAATITNGFVGYLSAFVVVHDILACSIVILLITLLACWGITESVTVAAIVTVIELIGLALVLWVLGGELEQLPQRWPELIPTFNKDIWISIFLGAFLAFYAFIGFEDMVNVTEEVINPEYTMPRAIFLALSISSLLYIVISLVAIFSLPLDQLSSSDSPMVSLLEQKSYSASIIVGLISLIAVVNGALVQMIMGARVLYGMGKQGLAPTWLATIFPRTQTPIIATVIIACSVWLLAIGFPLITLAQLTSFIIIGVFALVNLSLVIIQIQESFKKRVLQTSIVIPIIGTLLCIGFLVLQLISVFRGDIIATH